jgi:hypothetical protein
MKTRGFAHGLERTCVATFVATPPVSDAGEEVSDR